jgi:hypothetical protein
MHGATMKMTDQVSHPYKTTGKIVVLYVSICFTLLVTKAKDVHLHAIKAQAEKG